jgi:hypothetical protein
VLILANSFSVDFKPCIPKTIVTMEIKIPEKEKGNAMKGKNNGI